jgi:hypothetical protein
MELNGQVTASRFSEEDDQGLRKNTWLASWEDFPKNRGNRETCEIRSFFNAFRSNPLSKRFPNDQKTNFFNGVHRTRGRTQGFWMVFTCASYARPFGPRRRLNRLLPILEPIPWLADRFRNQYPGQERSWARTG